MMRINLKETLVGKRIEHIGLDYLRLEDGTVLSIAGDYGDCCGYAEFEFVTRGIDFEDNVITDVSPDYMDDYYSGEESFQITVFTHDESFDIEGEVGSGSGWDYGQCIKITVNDIEEKEE